MRTSQSPPIYFPPIESADEDGLLMLGGQLTPEWLLAAYGRAIFPWPVIDRGWEILAWFSPDPRAIIELDDFHVSRRLRRRLRQGQFQVTCNTDFRAVMEGCAAPRAGEPGTWITADMLVAYQRLHRLGHAHSIETWQRGQLVGGIYGVSLGGLFAGESMFHTTRDASKVALYALVQQLKSRGFVLLDIQQATDHTRSLGATEISRTKYVRRLNAAITMPVTFGDQLEVWDRSLGP